AAEGQSLAKITKEIYTSGLRRALRRRGRPTDDLGWRHGLGRAGSPSDPRARDQARVSLLKGIKLSDDLRAHAWTLATTARNSFPRATFCNPGSRLGCDHSLLRLVSVIEQKFLTKD